MEKYTRLKLRTSRVESSSEIWLMQVPTNKTARSYAPGPKRGLPFRSLFTYRRGPLPYLEKLAAQYGDISRFRIGPREAFFLNHPDLIKEVLVTSNQKFMKGL